MSDKRFVNIEFHLQWTSSAASHNDCFLLNVDLDNDKLPGGFKEEIKKLSDGESYSQEIQAKDLLGDGYSSNKVTTFDSSLFDSQFKNQHSPPFLYRFYPSAIAHKGLDTSEKDYTPFRLISKNSDEMIADRNHPLAKYYLTLKALKVGGCSKTAGQASKESVKRDITRIITSKGPGMQAPFEFGNSILFDDYPYKRKNKDTLVKTLIDEKTKAKIQKLYSDLLPNFSKVLDVMSHEDSYLSEDYKTGMLTGIGESESSLTNNKRLDTYEAQNLNENTILPFEDNSFDDAICTLSITSLADPLALFKEIARVVNSNGKFIVAFTDVYSAEDSISLWGQLHPFERVQLVLEYFRKSGLFSDLNTLSQRAIKSNSVYAVWGNIR